MSVKHSMCNETSVTLLTSCIEQAIFVYIKNLNPETTFYLQGIQFTYCGI